MKRIRISMIGKKSLKEAMVPKLRKLVSPFLWPGRAMVVVSSAIDE